MLPTTTDVMNRYRIWLDTVNSATGFETESGKAL
jgi:hypothetical protein